ncbi:hypothetical protein ASE63_04585 [Bosea sp. Root381]|uniref:hypothetical protein n=1 Tax=Bosea sp. Root381 TaxID=1736524 RepID=UPI0006FEBB90|nr:hypothetical protein [Bosea sp. Root381]KRE09803.1 hypothetical protein ASE63_04585 [Bosea sp. Root381]
MGAPSARRGSSDVVEVTDGVNQARAWCCLVRKGGVDAPVIPAWCDEGGEALGWQPTHWRIADPLSGLCERFEVE